MALTSRRQFSAKSVPTKVSEFSLWLSKIKLSTTLGASHTWRNLRWHKTVRAQFSQGYFTQKSSLLKIVSLQFSRTVWLAYHTAECWKSYQRINSKLNPCLLSRPERIKERGEVSVNCFLTSLDAFLEKLKLSRRVKIEFFNQTNLQCRINVLIIAYN